MEESAKKKKIPFELVVYPDASHAFNIRLLADGKKNRDYRSVDEDDAWERAVEMLRRYQPVP
jgi:dienelactone hydrolase